MENRTTRLSPLSRLGPLSRLNQSNRPNGPNWPNRLNKQGLDHERYMRLALHLARKALGRTSPNPMVGAVVVNGGRVIGEGFHRHAGAPHAEVDALRRAGSRARGATLYVTLEPCNHYGRTPPCCDAIIEAGISRVVIAVRDPNPVTNGRGMTRLRRAGIEVAAGVLEQKARELNAAFFKVMTAGLPLVIAKVGQSLDGKIATSSGESRWITSGAARRFSHQLRSRVDAILVGINTIVQDDPLLTVREAARRPERPIKVIVDSGLRVSPAARIFSTQSPAPTLIATTVRASSKRSALLRRDVEVVTLPPRDGRVPLRRLCRLLVRRDVHSLLIEGGGEVLASAFAERLVDRVLFFIAPILIGGRTAPGSLGGPGIQRLSQGIWLEEMTVQRAGRDLCIEARVVYPKNRGRGQGAGGRGLFRTTHAPRPTPHAPSVSS